MFLFYLFFLYCSRENKSEGKNLRNQYTITIRNDSLIDTLNMDRALHLSLISGIDFKIVIDEPIYAFILSKTKTEVCILLFLSPEEIDILDEDENEIYFVFTESNYDSLCSSHSEDDYDNLSPVFRTKNIISNTNIFFNNSKKICLGKRNDIKDLLIKKLFYGMFDLCDVEGKKYFLILKTLEQINLNLKGLLIKLSSKKNKPTKHKYRSDEEIEELLNKKLEKFLKLFKICDDDFALASHNFHEPFRNKIKELIEQTLILYFKLVDSKFLYYVNQELNPEESLIDYLIFFDFLTFNRFYPEKFFLKKGNFKEKLPEASGNHHIYSAGNSGECILDNGAYVELSEISDLLRESIQSKISNTNYSIEGEIVHVNEPQRKLLNHFDSITSETEFTRLEFFKLGCTQCEKKIFCVIERHLNMQKAQIKKFIVYNIPKKLQTYDVPKKPQLCDGYETQDYDVPRKQQLYDVPKKKQLCDDSRTQVYDVPSNKEDNEKSENTQIEEVQIESQDDSLKIIEIKDDSLILEVEPYFEREYRNNVENEAKCKYYNKYNDENIESVDLADSGSKKDKITSSASQDIFKSPGDHKKKNKSKKKGRPTKIKNKNKKIEKMNKNKTKPKGVFFFSSLVYKILGWRLKFPSRLKKNDELEIEVKPLEISSPEIDVTSLDNKITESNIDDPVILNESKKDYSFLKSTYRDVYHIDETYEEDDILSERKIFNDVNKLISILRVDNLDKHQKYYCLKIIVKEVKSKDVSKIIIHRCSRNSSCEETFALSKKNGGFKVFEHQNGLFLFFEPSIFPRNNITNFAVELIKNVRDGEILLYKTEELIFETQH